MMGTFRLGLEREKNPGLAVRHQVGLSKPGRSMRLFGAHIR
jgi:hypothetical protein